MPLEAAAAHPVLAGEPSRPTRGGAVATFPRFTGMDNGHRFIQQPRGNADMYPPWLLVLIHVGSAILAAAVTTAIVLGVIWLLGT